MKHPKAIICMNNGSKIQVELFPEKAPNTVNSFIFAVSCGVYDMHAIERIVPGSWIDFSYTAFGKNSAKYLIPYEASLDENLKPLPVETGCIAMGGYGELGISGCEIFFPLRKCPELTGKYPVFGKVLEGMEELYRLEKVQTVPIVKYSGIEIHRPVEPQIIKKVTLELYGQTYPEPIRLEYASLPLSWK